MNGRREVERWWATNPMTYGLDHGAATYSRDGVTTTPELGSRGFFEQVDRELYDWNRPLHDSSGPFGAIFPYTRFRGQPVLEIGCGMGAMAMLWAQSGACLTASDLNPVAVQQTRRRLGIFGLEASVCQQDARALAFRAETFSYVYSWGVLHHSPDLPRSLAELFRVLRAGGEFGLMLYHRHSLLHAYHTLYLEGLLHGESRFLCPLELASRYGDGHRQEGNPHTWPVTRRELREMLRPHARDVFVRTLGTELDQTFRFLVPGLGERLPRIVKKAWARRFGWSLWVAGRKRADVCVAS